MIHADTFKSNLCISWKFSK